jgi:hypothetical protein
VVQSSVAWLSQKASSAKDEETVTARIRQLQQPVSANQKPNKQMFSGYYCPFFECTKALSIHPRLKWTDLSIFYEQRQKSDLEF